MEIGGIKVKDARKSVIIIITPKDVKLGANKNPSSCAAALACKRQLHATDARIHLARAYLKISGEWHRYRTSRSLRSEIIAFDRGGVFTPREYTLKTIPRKNEGIKRTKPPGQKETHVKIAKRFYHHITDVRERGANR